MKSFQPSSDRVLILADRPEEMTKSGLLIPANARTAPTTGRVVGVGPDCGSVKIGDHVAFGQYAGSEITLSNDPKDKHFLIRENMVFGKFGQED